MTLQRGVTYRISDPLTSAEKEQFDVETPQQQAAVRAVWTGEKRPPLKGEWYLSGAIIEAYRAPNDFPTAYHIARLVKTESEMVVRVVLEPAQHKGE